MLAHKLKNAFAFTSFNGVFAELTSQFDLALRYKKRPTRGLFLYRGSQIRTDDILLPKQTLYQAELHPDFAQI